MAKKNDDGYDETEVFLTKTPVVSKSQLIKNLIMNHKYIAAKKLYEEFEPKINSNVKAFYRKNMPNPKLLQAFSENNPLFKVLFDLMSDSGLPINDADRWLVNNIVNKSDIIDPLLKIHKDNPKELTRRYNELKAKNKLTREDMKYYRGKVGERPPRLLEDVRKDIENVKKWEDTENKIQELTILANELLNVGGLRQEYDRLMFIVDAISQRVNIHYAVCSRKYTLNGIENKQQLIIKLSPESYEAYKNGAQNFSYITKKGNIKYFRREDEHYDLPVYGNNHVVSIQGIVGGTSATLDFTDLIIEFVDTFNQLTNLKGHKHFLGRELVDFDKFISVESDGTNCIDNYLKSIGCDLGANVKDLDGFVEICENLNVEIYNPDLSLYKSFGTGEHQVIYMCNHLYIPKRRLNGVVLGELKDTNTYEEVDNIDEIINENILSNKILDYNPYRSKIMSADKTILVKPMPEEKRICEKFNIDFRYQSVKMIAEELISDDRTIYSNPYHDKMMDDLKTIAYSKSHVDNVVFNNLDRSKMLKLDIKRCHTNILKTWLLPNNNDWINWKVVKCNKYMGPGFYYIVSDINEYFKSNSWVWGGIIEMFDADIKYYIKMDVSYVDISKITDVCNGDDDEKLLLNVWIGAQGYTGKCKKMVITNDAKEISVYKGKDIDTIRYIGDFQEIVYKDVKPFYKHARYLYYAIVQISRYMLYKQECDILAKYPDCRILEQLTDSTLFIKGIQETDASLSHYKMEEIPLNVGNYHGYNYYKNEPEIKEWYESDCYGLLLGGGGTGKTTLLSKKTGYNFYACTNSAAANLKNGSTLANLFRMLPNSDYGMLKYPHWANKKIIVDECSQIDSKMLSILATLKAYDWDIILAGDFLQLPPVNGDDIEKSPVLGYLCDWGYKILTKTHRFADQQYADDIRNFKFPNLPTGELTRMNLCYTHDMEKKINKKYRFFKKGGKIIKPYYRLPEKKKIKYKNFIITTDFIFDLIDGKLVRVFSPNVFTIPFSRKFEKTNVINYHRAQGLTINVPHTLYELYHEKMTDRARYVAYSRCVDPKHLFINF